MYGKAPGSGKFARRNTPAPGRRAAARCSGLSDIHKNLWITVWIVDE
jgi:hypothetical protein